MNNTSSNRGLSFIDALTLIFIILKLLGKIQWSWVWVLSPLWISFIIRIILYVLIDRD